MTYIFAPLHTCTLQTLQYRGERGRAVKALDSGSQGSGFKSNSRPAGSLCPWTRHFTSIVPWFGGHVKPSVTSEVLSITLSDVKERHGLFEKSNPPQQCPN